MSPSPTTTTGRESKDTRATQHALAVLAERVYSMPSDALAAWMDEQDPKMQALVEEAIGRRLALGWRAHPAAMANRLTGGTYLLYPYVVLLSTLFAAGIHGEDPRQLWNMPSQYGKTTICGQWGPIWALDEDPTRRIMYVSYDADKAVETAGEARDLAEKYADQLNFRLRPDRRARGRWSTEQGGGLYATGVNGAITGFPADVVIGDDLIKGWKEAHSETVRDTTMNVYRAQMRLRIQRAVDFLLICGTRWHEQDPTGVLLGDEILGRGEGWHLTRLAAIAEKHEPNSPDPLLRDPDPLGRAPGETLGRYEEEEVRTRARVLGSYLAAGLEQQRPAPPEGGEIKRAWFRLESSRPAVADQWISSWDTKLKDKATGDYVVGQVWARTGSSYWLLDQLRGQWNQATVECALALTMVRWPKCRTHYIENTGNGPEVMEALRKAHPDYEVSDEVAITLGMTTEERAKVQEWRRRGLGGLIPVTVKGDKRVRVRAVSPYIEAGDVHVMEDSPFLGIFLDEVAAFPTGAHDDQVDAMSQALSKLARPPAAGRGAATQRPVPAPPPSRTASGPRASGGGAAIFRPRGGL